MHLCEYMIKIFVKINKDIFSKLKIQSGVCFEIDNNTRMDRPKRPPPPVPKFQDKRDQADLEQKLNSFINEISQSQSHSIPPPNEQKPHSVLNSSPIQPPPLPQAAKPQPPKEEGGKKKFALASLNSKLNNMLSTKKINVSSALSTEMQKEKHEQKKPIEVQYDFQHPNSYELVKQNYAAQFAVLAEQDSDPQSIEQKQPEQNMDQQYQPEEKEQIALRMMQKFGYKVGEGLGKQSQGIRTPLIVRKTTDSAGVIELSNIPLNYLITREVSAKNALTAHGVEVTEVVVLVGALTMQELEQGLQEQIRQQCCIHGVVCDWLLFLVGEQLCIFVQFQSKEQALHAFAQMNGKYFGEKLVSLRFYPTKLFHERQLNQPTHPHIPL